MKKERLDRKQAIISASIEIIDENGIHGFSTRKVSNRLGISEGTIFRYFQTKNELLLAILDRYSQHYSEITKAIKEKNLAPIEAIEFFIASYAAYYESDPKLTAVAQIADSASGEDRLKEKAMRIFQMRCEYLQALITEAQKSGVLSRDIDSVKLSEIIWGGFWIICLKWRLYRYSFPLREYTLAAIKMLLKSFIQKDQ